MCPKSGLLKRSRHVPVKATPVAPPQRIRLSDDQLCLKLNGQWELVTVVELPGPHAPGSRYDVVLKRRVSAWDRDVDSARAYFGEALCATSRRPLSKRELLRLPIPIEWLK